MLTFGYFNVLLLGIDDSLVKYLSNKDLEYSRDYFYEYAPHVI